jgi:hypothetical protein
MKSTTNRYRPPRVQYRLDDWTRKKNVPSKDKQKKNTNTQGPKFK